MIAAAFSWPASGALAGAWPLEPGRAQLIAKYERTTASTGYDRDSAVVDIDPRRDENLSVFVERGLTPRLTLQAKAGVTRGHDRWAKYSGRGPIEAGLRWAVLRDERSSLAVYLGAGEAGAGRNAGYAAPGQGSLDLEGRVFYGRSATWRGRPLYVEVQAARLKRQGLADDQIARLGKLDVPVVVVGGGRDPIAPPGWVTAMASDIPGGRAVIVPGAPHAMNYTSPRRLARIIRAVAAQSHVS